MTVFDLIAAEQARAKNLRDSGKLRWVASDPDCPDHKRLEALVEEIGEVARALHDGESHERLLEELIQVAGVAASWAEYLIEFELVTS